MDELYSCIAASDLCGGRSFLSPVSMDPPRVHFTTMPVHCIKQLMFSWLKTKLLYGTNDMCLIVGPISPQSDLRIPTFLSYPSLLPPPVLAVASDYPPLLVPTLSASSAPLPVLHE